MKNLFQKEENQINGKENSIFQVFWKESDLINFSGKFSSLFHDILNLLNTVLVVLVQLCDPKFCNFERFINNILKLVVRNVNLSYLSDVLPIYPETLLYMIRCNYNYDLISKELENRNLNQSKTSKSNDKSEKTSPENNLKQSHEKSGEILQEEKTISGLDPTKKENQEKSADFFEVLTLNENSVSEIISQHKTMDKSANFLSKTNDNQSPPSEEFKASDKSNSLGSSLKSSKPSMIKIKCLSSPLKYSLEYLDHFNIDFLKHEPQEEHKNRHHSTIFNYICSFYCLKKEIGEERCRKISKNLNKLDVLDEESVKKFCNLNTRNVLQKIRFLQKFFSEDNAKVWDIYNLERSIGEVEDEKINEVYKILENGTKEEILIVLKNYKQFNPNLKK